MKKLLAILICVTFVDRGMATESPLPVPQDFMFKGKPVQPDCIEKFSGDSSRFELIYLDSDKCQTGDKSYDPEEIKKGLLGYSSADGSTYTYYKHLGMIHLQGLKTPLYHLIYTEWSGGGTGRFSSIDVVEKSGDTLRLVDSIAGGDRCTGGLSDVEYKNGILTYKQHVTPLDLYVLIQKQPNTKVNFSSCAACCMGKVAYQGSDITGFTFAQDGAEALPVEPTLPQGCYNQIIKETLAEGKNTLTFKELKSFMQKIEKTCVNRKFPSVS